MNKLTDAEYGKLVRRVEFNDTVRNNLLTFSFTVVLTILGIALQMKSDTTSVWIPLLPFLVIIPFAGRISYYRLSSAHIGAFLRVYAGDSVKFELGAKNVGECMGMGKMYSFISFLVNHEMVILGLACCIVFYLKYIPIMNQCQWQDYAILLAPAVLEAIVYAVAHSTDNYSGMVKTFKEEWEKNLINEEQ